MYLGFVFIIVLEVKMSKKNKKNFIIILIDFLKYGFHSWIKCIGKSPILRL